MKNYLTYSITLLLLITACNQKMDKETYSRFQMRGNEIANQAQGVLLSNVGSAIQKGGPEYAVEFCNLEVSGIVDSLNRINNCTISRVSEKNRNPENSLETKADLKIWNVFKQSAQSDTVVMVKNNLVYYKRINTAMPACLKCHGDTQKEINTATLEKLHKLYPNDLATGYQLNDFRGLWKVEFSD
jgi:cytochrome c553